MENKMAPKPPHPNPEEMGNNVNNKTMSQPLQANITEKLLKCESTKATAQERNQTSAQPTRACPPPFQPEQCELMPKRLGDTTYF